MRLCDRAFGTLAGNAPVSQPCRAHRSPLKVGDNGDRCRHAPPTGIYVIESKNYSGWVFGRADQRNWTVCLNRNTKERVPNPIRQNEGHIAALMRLLDLPRDAFVSLVVFSERCELKRVPDDTDDVLVLHRDRLVGRVRRLIGRRDARFDAAQVESIAHALDVLAEESSVEERRRHAVRVKEEMPHQ